MVSVSCDAPKGISPASRLPFALNLTKTTSAIPPDRLAHWYDTSAGNDAYENSKIGIRIEDAHEGNLIQIQGGELVPIDVHIIKLRSPKAT